MPEYQYTVIDSQGQRQNGKLVAGSLEEAEQILTGQQEWKVEQLTLVTEQQPVKPESQLTRWESEQLVTTLSDLTSGQLPVETGLRMLSKEVGGSFSPFSWRIRSRMNRLADLMESGHPLDQALKIQGAAPDLLAAVQAGIRTGNPGLALSHYITYLRSVMSLRNQLIGGLAYSAVLTASCLALFLFLYVYIIPMFAAIYHGFDIELYFPTRLILSLGLFLRTHFVLLFVILPAIAVGCCLLLLLVPAYPRRWLLLKIPFFGQILHSMGMSRFVHTIGFLVENNVPLPESLRLAGAGARDAVIQQTAFAWADCLELGESLSETSKRLRGIPATLFESATRQHNQHIFARTLHALGEMYESRARLKITMLITMLEPALIVMIGMGFIWTIGWIFFPLIRLMNDLS